MLLLLLLTNAFVLLPWAGAGRIIGGREAVPHSRPYMAFVRIHEGSQSCRCGGALIRPDAVLTAGHCVYKKGIQNVTVILGAHNISGQEPSQQRIAVGTWVIHPDYPGKDRKNDIALLKLNQKAQLNANVQCIPIPNETETVGDGTLCTVSGWGRTSLNPPGSDVLMQVELKVQKDEICEQVSNKYERESMICVGDDNHQKSTYKGDSGSPLVCNGKAHGTLSGGIGDPIFPKVFARISHFEPWIRQQLMRFSRKAIPCFPSSD